MTRIATEVFAVLAAALGVPTERITASTSIAGVPQRGKTMRMKELAEWREREKQEYDRNAALIRAERQRRKEENFAKRNKVKLWK